MVEFLFGLGVVFATVFATYAFFSAIPAVASMFTVATGSTGQLVAAIEAFIGLIDTYITPWVGLLNNILPIYVKQALIAMIIWRLVRPIGLNILEATTGASRKIVEKLL